MSQLPPKPDFAAIEAAASHQSANRRTFIMALIGNLVYSWANNESMFIHMLMVLMNTDEASAAVVFATLNTTRARPDLVERLAKLKLKDRSMQKTIERIIKRFNELTKIRNEFNHCMYTLDERGEITHTHSIRLQIHRSQAEGRQNDGSHAASTGNGVSSIQKLHQRRPACCNRQADGNRFP